MSPPCAHPRPSRPVRSMSARVATTSAGSDAVHRLDAVRAVEDEREVVPGLLVAGHERDQALGVGAAGQHATRGRSRRPPAGGARPGPRRYGPSRRARRAAKTRPTATASPWRRSDVGTGAEGRGLEGMGQGVAVVEDRPPSPLELVGGHHCGLDRGAAGHLLVQREIEQPGSGRDRRVDGAASSAYLAISPRPEAHSRGGSEVSSSVSHSTDLRLPERPHQVLPLRQVHPGLAADGRVDLAQQAGGHVHVGRPAVEGRPPRTRPRR